MRPLKGTLLNPSSTVYGLSPLRETDRAEIFVFSGFYSLHGRRVCNIVLALIVNKYKQEVRPQRHSEPR